MKRPTLPRGVYRRGDILWIRYGVPKAIAAEHGCARLQRESTESGDQREASRQLAQRRRELRDGSWRPKALAGGNVRTYAERWTADRQKAGLRSADRDLEFLRPILEHIGEMRLGDVRRVHVLNAMAALRAKPTKRGARAPRTTLKAYKKLHAMFASALRAELILTNPCTLLADGVELPKNGDKDPKWRLGAKYARNELWMLITDRRIPTRRRVLYALGGVAGLRKGEIAARTLRDYDHEAQPLGKLRVETQYEDGVLKMENPREVPVHHVLAALLDEWIHDAFALTYGRRPKPDDLLVPSQRGKVMEPSGMWSKLQEDLEMLGLRRRRMHDLRRTFISLARDDGANKDLLRWVTHGPDKGDIMDVYTTPDWSALCAEVSKLRIGPNSTPPAPLRLVTEAQDGAQFATKRSTARRF